MADHPRIDDAPGLSWRHLKTGWEARWQPRSDLIKRGCQMKSARLWKGRGEPTEAETAYISDECQRLQAQMLVWARTAGTDVPEIASPFDGTLGSLIEAYQTDKDSSYHRMRFSTRKNHSLLMRRIIGAHGHDELQDINARLLLSWHKEWSEGGKVSMGHGFVAQLRTLFGFGATILEEPECERLSGIMHRMRFAMPAPRTERMTADQAAAIRAMASKMGLYSIALAQAFQFELMLRQKDVVGEWVPAIEPGVSDLVDGDQKWLVGLRWSEIDENFILRHTTSKRGKPLQVNLNLAGMVMEELRALSRRQWLFRSEAMLALVTRIRSMKPKLHDLQTFAAQEAKASRGFIAPPMARSHFPTTGPVIVSEYTRLPFLAVEFRRKWRMVAKAAGVPDAVRNMDSRAGGISEATDAGASLELVRHAATHSNVATTANYSRGSVEKVADVMVLRASHRNKKGTSGGGNGN